MAEIKIIYVFGYAQQDAKTFELCFDGNSMEYIPRIESPLPEWTRLGCHQCENCPLQAEQTPYCPVARNIHGIVSHFANDRSYAQTTVGVITQDRTYLKTASLQEGLFGILGLVMATSGCPHMNFLKPMARFHMPFASINETLIRTLSIYLLKQYFQHKKELPADWNLDQLEAKYQNVNTVNRGIIARIRTMAQGDADQNAIVVLDGFAMMLAVEKSNNFSEIEALVADS